MRHWIGLAVAGCAAVALRLVPPSEMVIPAQPAPPQDYVYYQTLSGDLARANARLQHIRLADRIIPATLAHDGPLAFGAPEDVDPQEADRVRADAVLDAQAALEGGTSVALGLFYVDVREGAYPNAPRGSFRDAEYYFGERDGRAYCVTVGEVYRFTRDQVVHLAGTMNYQSRLGVCQAVARYGLPGSAVRAWLERGGTGMAATLTPSDPESFGFSTFFGTTFQRRGALGLLVVGNSSLHTLAGQQCLAGLSQGCAGLLMKPVTNQAIRYSFAPLQEADLFHTTPLSAVLQTTLLYPADMYVLADLAAEFGEARVRRWWTANGPTDVAFRDAFGVDPGAWYEARVAELMTITQPGPKVAWNGALGALALLALGTLAGGAWATRRRVA